MSSDSRPLSSAKKRAKLGELRRATERALRLAAEAREAGIVGKISAVLESIDKKIEGHHHNRRK